MVEAVGVGGGVVAVAAIASPALAYLCGEGASAYVDACHCLDGLWLALFVVACGGGCEGASAEVYLAGGVDALASIAAACHGEGATRHGEVTVALDACCAAVVVFFLVVHAVAACGDGGGAACDDDNGVGLDASCCIGCDVDADGSVIDPESVVDLDACACGCLDVEGDVVLDDDIVIGGDGMAAVACDVEGAVAHEVYLSLAEECAFL